MVQSVGPRLELGGNLVGAFIATS